MTLFVLIRAEEWFAVALALSGILLGLHFALDNRRDLHLYRRRGWNGFAELSGIQGVRSGYGKACLHAMLSVLPVVSLMTSPSPSRYGIALIFFTPLCVGQLIVIWAQALNWRDRRRLLRKLARNRPDSPTTPQEASP